MRTARDEGWDELKNGELLKRAEKAGYEVVITTDKKMEHQQNIEKKRIALIVLTNTSWREIKARVPTIRKTIKRAERGRVSKVEVPYETRTGHKASKRDAYTGSLKPPGTMLKGGNISETQAGVRPSAAAKTKEAGRKHDKTLAETGGSDDRQDSRHGARPLDQSDAINRPSQSRLRRPLPEPADRLLRGVVVNAEVKADRLHGAARSAHLCRLSGDPLVHRGLGRIPQLKGKDVIEQGSKALRSRPPLLSCFVSTL